MPRAIGSLCRSLWMAAREETSSAAKGGLRSAAATALRGAGRCREPELVGDRRGQVVGAERRGERRLVGDHEAVARVLGRGEARRHGDEPRVHDLAAERQLERPAGARAGRDVGARDDGQAAVVERLPRAEHGLLRRVDHVAQRQRAAAGLTSTPPWPRQAASGGRRTRRWA